MKEGQGRGRSKKEDQNGQKGQTKGKAKTSPRSGLGPTPPSTSTPRVTGPTTRHSQERQPPPHHLKGPHFCLTLTSTPLQGCQEPARQKRG